MKAQTTRTSTLCDEELVLACQRDDSRAFDILMRRYQATVCSELHSLAPDWNDRADLTQEVFIRIWRSIGQLREPRAFRRWLHMIVMNVFRDEARKRLRTRMISLDEPICDDGAGRDVADLSTQPDDMRWRAEIASSVQDAMERLPRNFRKSLELRECYGMSYEEISEHLGCPIGTVKSRVNRARDKMRILLEPRLAA